MKRSACRLAAVLFGLAIASWASLAQVDGDALSSTQAQDAISRRDATEAPAGLDLTTTNGFVDQATMDAAREAFDEVEDVADGLGPVFNDKGCGVCHNNPVSGGDSLITELRAGVFRRGRFIEHPGGSLIHQQAIDPAIQETVLPGYPVRALRKSTSLLGLGFVEAVSNRTLRNVAAQQATRSRGKIAGTAINVAVAEAGGATRVGRFGWKDQQASLISFAADAYLNEMGITSPLQAVENTSNGNSVSAYDKVPDPEDDGTDVDSFATFMRALKAPSRDATLANTLEAHNGARTFNTIGCNICHTETLVTAPSGTRINAGQFTVPPALGNKIIHPYSDFLLHDIGSGDGIVQNGGAATRTKLRTVPLWGLRLRERFMHDAASTTPQGAIRRHDGEASGVLQRYRQLPETAKQELDIFLRSL